MDWGGQNNSLSVGQKCFKNFSLKSILISIFSENSELQSSTRHTETTSNSMLSSVFLTSTFYPFSAPFLLCILIVFSLSLHSLSLHSSASLLVSYKKENFTTVPPMWLKGHEDELEINTDHHHKWSLTLKIKHHSTFSQQDFTSLYRQEDTPQEQPYVHLHLSVHTHTPTHTQISLVPKCHSLQGAEMSTWPFNPLKRNALSHANKQMTCPAGSNCKCIKVFPKTFSNVWKKTL